LEFDTVPIRLRRLWLPAAILAALVPVFIGLGVWQLQRAEEKRVLQEEYDRGTNAAPLQLDTRVQNAQQLRFHRIVVRGVYDPDYQILIDNRVRRGVPGYHVVTPLKIEGGDTRLLVNRGWIALGATREHLPNIDTPAGRQEISGVATVPAEKVFTLGEAPSLERGWQPLWPHLDLQRYRASVPFAVQPVVLLLDADSAHGFTREWSRLDAGIALHQGYAFQWFALAVLAAIILALMLRRASRPEPQMPA
ncbi:MAG TPA: SURF1 family protein, partial [Burkholderiaceae bacterium]|nr:SURF1 family protein [Burkholderiaceae bacterium]